jgi:hypothetical protein
MAIRVAGIRQAASIVLQNAYPDVQIATAPDQINPPSLYIGMPSVQYNVASQGGLDVASWPIVLVLLRTPDQGTMDFYDELAAGTGDRSLRSVLQEDQTLGGACQTLAVRAVQATEWNTGTGGQLPSATWEVEVYG